MIDSGLPPTGPLRLVHEFQFVAEPGSGASPALTSAPPLYPDTVPGRPDIVPAFQFSAGPQAVPAVAAAKWRIHLDVPPGPPHLAHTFQFFSGPSANSIANASFLPYGPAGAATFILSLEPGTKLTYSWGTDIFKSYSGAEQRVNATGPLPRQRIEGVAFLLDNQDRDLRTSLQRAAAAGSTFLVALPYEELILTTDSTGTTVTVNSTASCDWAIVTQRVAVVGTDGVATSAVIQAVTATTIRLDVAPAVHAGARIMPLLSVLLDPQQGFARYPVNVGLWSIRCMANAFGWVGNDSMGRGAQIVTYAAGMAVSVASLTDADLLIWDRPNLIDGTSTEAMLSLAETVDLGGLPFAQGGADAPDWGRPILYSSADAGEWQWLKAFLRQTLGRQRAFLLSTNHADLVFVSATGSSLKVQSSTVSGAGDYATWWTSKAHRRLALTKVDGSSQYVMAMAITDNHDGTLTLILDASVTGTVSRVSFLEQVRFDNGDSDDFHVTWDGVIFSVDLIARTTEEAISAPGYPTTATEMAVACRAGTWTAGYLCEDSGSGLAPAFGGTTLAQVTSSGSPAYRIAGPLDDRAVRITLASTGFESGSTSFLDVNATSDLCGVAVIRTQLPLSTVTYIVSKSDFSGGPGYVLTMSSTAISVTADHASPGNVTASATVPDAILANNEWFAVMFAMDRGASAMRVAIQSLDSGLLSIGSTQSTATIGSLSNASAPFRINRSGTLGNTLEIAALYIGTGVGAATGMSAGLATALSSFVNYLGA